MSFTKNFLIECSRQNEENVKITQRNTGKENASWVNKVNFNFEVGDQVNCENIVVHSIGASADSTVELSGENEESTGLVDNVIGIRFNNYICDNAYNSIHLPAFFPNTIGDDVIGFVPDNITPVAPTKNNNINGLDMPGLAMPVRVEFTTPTYTMPQNYGAPVTSNNEFDFLYTVLKDGSNQKKNYMSGYFGENPKTARTLFGFRRSDNVEEMTQSVSGKKYTKLHNDYVGPYRRGTSVTETGAEFFYSKGDDLPLFETSIIVEVDAPIYESPSTICNKINETFHETIPIDEVPKTGVMPKDAEGRILPHVAGPLNTIINANGKPYISTEDGWTADRVKENRCWGNMCVEDVNKWKAIHAMMRCSLAFSGKLRYYGSPDQFQWYSPIIYLDGHGMKQNFKTSYGGALTNATVRGYLPRSIVQYEQSCKDQLGGAEHNNISSSIAYTVIPKYFVISTNIEYTAENVARIKIWFDNMKIYKGTYTNIDDINDDTENWFVYTDIGRSMDGVNTKDAPVSFDWSSNEKGEIYSFGGYHVDGATQNTPGDFYAPCTGLAMQVKTGKFNVRKGDTLDPTDYPGQQQYAFGIAMNPYSSHTRNGDTLNYSCCPRSDIPGEEYSFYEYGRASSTGYPSVNRQYKTYKIDTDVPCRFQHNEQGDASMKIFANQLNNFFDVMRFDNCINGGTVADETDKEGFGEWRRAADLTADSFDTSLSDGYGVYGCDIVDSDVLGDYYYDVYGMYWSGLYTIYESTETTNVYIPYKFFYYWENGTSDGGGTQNINGKIDVMQWNDADSKFGKNTGTYVYSISTNLTYKDASHNPTNYTINGGDAIDMSDPKTFFIFTNATDAFVGELVRYSAAGDKGQLNSMKLTPIDAMTESELENSLYGGRDSENRVVVVDMMVVQTNDESKGYNQYDLEPPASTYDIDLNNKFPTETHVNSAKCCCFIVAEDSATWDGSKWNPKNPCALPNIYHGTPFGPSPSFMDSPVTWLLNQERNDDNGDDATGSAQMQNYMMIGANDPTCQFDSALSRAKFFNLHTQRILGGREMPVTTDGSGNQTISKETLGQFVIKLHDTTYYYQAIENWSESYDTGTPANSTATVKSGVGNTGLSTSISGLSIVDLFSQPKGDLATDVLNMTLLTADNFYNCLLYKLGFTFKQFFPDFGLPYNWLDPAVQGKNDSVNRYKSCKPISTNAEISISDAPNLAIQDATKAVRYGTSSKDTPTYQLGFTGGEGVSLDGTQSQAIVAKNLPLKMDDAFYQVYSDIIPTNYKSEGENLNIIGIAMKNYIEGDFVYGFASSYTTTCEFPLKIGSINTEIRLPNGQLAPIDQKSSVIYKVQRQMTLPNIENIMQDIQKNEKKN